MARYRRLVMAVAVIVAGCERSPQLPYTSAEAEQLRWLDGADAQADFRDRVERQHDTRFISFYALSFVGEFGIPDTPDTQELIQKHGSWHIQGTTDLISSSEHLRLRRKASEYAQEYNSLLLRYLHDHPNT